jgi:hypothetical protein
MIAGDLPYDFIGCGKIKTNIQKRIGSEFFACLKSLHCSYIIMSLNWSCYIDPLIVLLQSPCSDIMFLNCSDI